MFHINDNFQKLPGSYLFAEIARRVKEYQQAHPDADIIRLGIGDVTKPLVPAVIDAMHKAVEEMGHEETFRGYGPDFGYDFLVNSIREGDYASRGINLAYDEVFVSDGAKCDVGNIQELFSDDAVIAVTDQGAPIPREELEAIFRRFYRADRARSTQGFGLGLAIARSIAQEHRGKLWAQSDPAGYNTFFCSLPLA